jgi:hypothetical protein
MTLGVNNSPAVTTVFMRISPVRSRRSFYLTPGAALGAVTFHYGSPLAATASALLSQRDAMRITYAETNATYRGRAQCGCWRQAATTH